MGGVLGEGCFRQEILLAVGGGGGAAALFPGTGSSPGFRSEAVLGLGSAGIGDLLGNLGAGRKWCR